MMDTSSIQRMFAALSLPSMILWSLVFLLILVAVAIGLRFELRRFRQLGKNSSWWWLRLSFLPILLLTAAVVIVPARAISGPEALAAFYIALFTLAPLTWFALHWLVGAVVSPRLTRAESNGMAITGLAIVIGPLLVINVLQGPVFMASRQLNAWMLDNTEQVPLPHNVQAMQRFRLGDAGEIFAQTLQAPDGVTVEQVDAQMQGYWFDTSTSTSDYLCRRGNDLHLAWPAGSPPPPLRLFWHDRNGTRHQSAFTIDAAVPAALPSQSFAVGWRDDGIDLPVPMSMRRVQLGWTHGTQRLYYRDLNTMQRGEGPGNDCVMRGYHRLAWLEEGPVAGVMLRFHLAPPAAAWQYEILRLEHTSSNVTQEE